VQTQNLLLLSSANPRLGSFGELHSTLKQFSFSHVSNFMVSSSISELRDRSLVGDLSGQEDAFQ